MDNTTSNATVDNTSTVAANGENANGKQSKQAKVKNPNNLTFPIFVGSGENVVTNFVHPDEAKNPLSFIGAAVKQFDRQFSFYADFPSKTKLVIIPAMGRMGEKERALRGHAKYLQALTNGLEQADEIKDKEVVKVLEVYRSKGWKFTTLTKKSILTVADEKVKEASTTLRLIKAVTLASPELKKLVADNKNRVAIAKEVEINGIQAGLKLAKELSYKQLPSIKVD